MKSQKKNLKRNICIYVCVRACVYSFLMNDSIQLTEYLLFQITQSNKRTAGNLATREHPSRNFTMSEDGMIEVIPLSAIPEPSKNPAMGHWQMSCVACSPPPRQTPPSRKESGRRRRRRTPRYNSVSKIDRASRIVFPLFFLAINVFYWFAYLSRSERINYYNVNSNGTWDWSLNEILKRKHMCEHSPWNYLWENNVRPI